MIKRTTRLRWRRVFRRKQRQVEDMGVQAEESLEKHVIKRLNRLIDVRRFVTSWVLLFVFLSGALVWQFRVLDHTFQTLQPVAGGIYSEGMVGSFSNANPLFATSLADATVSHLVFAGLLTYDKHNVLTGDLAKSWSVDPQNTVYKVALKPNLTWHDGQPLTAEDVVYTFQSAQNPDAKSSLFRSWKGVKIEALDATTVQFTLPAPFAPFPHSLTTGIVPKHLLKDTAPSELRSSQFNTVKPVGAGPFEWSNVELVNSGKQDGEQRVGLKPFDKYHAGKPKLDGFVVRTYTQKDRLIEDFQAKVVSAMVGQDEVPETKSAGNKSSEPAPGVQAYNLTLAAETMAFFRTDSDLLKDVKVRQALVRSVNIPTVISALGYPATVADSPLLHGQMGYDPGLKQLGYSAEESAKLFDEAGWKRAAATDTRANATQPLTLQLVAQSTPELTRVSAELQKQWSAVGVDVKVSLVDDIELQNTIRDRAYDILLYGITIGADPDVFAYWHSTQADIRSASRLNFSDYKSSTADKALEAARSRVDPALRAAKYKPFLQAWRNDAPALALYQPRSLYITNVPLFGLDRNDINTGVDRLNNVQNWMVQQALRPSS